MPHLLTKSHSRAGVVSTWSTALTPRQCPGIDCIRSHRLWRHSPSSVVMSMLYGNCRARLHPPVLRTANLWPRVAWPCPSTPFYPVCCQTFLIQICLCTPRCQTVGTMEEGHSLFVFSSLLPLKIFSFFYDGLQLSTSLTCSKNVGCVSFYTSNCSLCELCGAM